MGEVVQFPMIPKLIPESSDKAILEDFCLEGKALDQVGKDEEWRIRNAHVNLAAEVASTLDLIIKSGGTPVVQELVFIIQEKLNVKHVQSRGK